MLAAAAGLTVAQQDPQTPQTPPQQQTPPLGQRTKPAPPPPEPGKDINPPEEDISIKSTEYTFNPLQAEHELKVGNDYFKRGKLRAAEGRFREATKWNEKYGEAWLRLGEVEQKLKDNKGAREAYTKYLEIATDAKNAGEVRKRMEKLK
jgi:tetratricopeptide (TPR) repeat protein